MSYYVISEKIHGKYREYPHHFPSRKRALEYAWVRTEYNDLGNGERFLIHEITPLGPKLVGKVIRQPITQDRYGAGADFDPYMLLTTSKGVTLYKEVKGPKVPLRIIQRDGTLKAIPRGWSA